MGSSKKNKDRDKKKKKRERSRSKEKDREKQHRRHHKHKKHRKLRQERSPSIDLSDLSVSDLEFPEERGSDSPKKGYYQNAVPSPPPAPKFPRQLPISFPPRSPTPPPTSPPHRPQAPPPPRFGIGDAEALSSGKESLSLSIEDTNKIRAKLGLKPLDVTPQVKDEENTYKPGEEIHKPPENLRDKLHIEKLREKIAAQREKRRQKEVLSQVKGLGESDEDDSALAWVSKSRKIDKERKEAEKRNKMLEELDAQFGVGDLVEEEMSHRKRHLYDSKHLSGLKVEHNTERFSDGNTTILTLKDSNILDNDEDTLVNVNMIDVERAERNVKRKRTKPDEVDYDAPEVDEYGNIIQKTLLTKYDEEIQGEKRQSFRIGARGEAIHEEIGQDSLRGPAKKIAKLRQLTSLSVPESQLATEYFTPEETVTFKKKKRKKKKKMLTADDLEPLPDIEQDHGNRRMTRVDGVKSQADEVSNSVYNSGSNVNKIKSLRELMEEDDEPPVKMEVDEEEKKEESESEGDDVELQEALARSRRVKLLERSKLMQMTDIISRKEQAPPSEQMEEDDANMTLNITDEFCRTLGDIPTYGLSGNRAEDDGTMIQASPPHQQDSKDQQGAWEEVDIDDTKVEISNEKSIPILEEEPDTGRGMANALRLAMKKGYLEKENAKKPANATLQHLRAVHYSIEDKTIEDDRRGGGGGGGEGRRGDRYMGPVMDFREKEYKPDVKLEYVDDEGRKLNAKEAFRYLSHKFHGKGSGKNKQEKRMKKWKEELLMKHMSSSDTPLQTLERQKEKQKQLGSAYLLLSGSKTQEPLEVKK